MDKEEKREAARFSENLDGQLGSQIAPPASQMSEDGREALAFAAKIKECRGEPAADFKENLKNSLLSKLSAQEAEVERRREPSLWAAILNAFRTKPILRTAAVAITLVLIALAAFWGAGLFSPGESPIVVATPPTGLTNPVVVVEISASFPQGSFAPGEPVEITLAFKNITRSPVTLSPFPPEITLTSSDSGEVVRVFEAGPEGKELGPLEEATYSLLWDQQGSGGQVPPGSYLLTITDVNAGEGKTAAASDLPLILIQ